MKKLYFSLFFLATVLCSQNVSAQNNQPEFVDLGLPSGTLWATTNLGATTPDEVGMYLAWGETQEKNEYSWATYKWCDGTQNKMTKYVIDATYGTVDDKKFLDKEDDASANGDNIGCPTVEELAELMNSAYCTWTLETINSRKGARVTGKNGNSIFIPAGGFKTGTRLSSNNSAGCLWSNGLTTTQAKYYYNANVIRFGVSRSNTISLASGDHNGAGFVPRNYGYNIRPVKRTGTSGVENIATSTRKEVAGIYNLYGIKLEEPANGINIIVYTDGTSQKVVMK